MKSLEKCFKRKFEKLLRKTVNKKRECEVLSLLCSLLPLYSTDTLTTINAPPIRTFLLLT